MMSKLIQIGSVKDIFESDSSANELIFRFSDRYSVFDWGEMPDHIENKGESLAYLGALFFKYLSNAKNWKNWCPENITLNSQEEEVFNRIKEEGVGNHFLRCVVDDARAFRVKRIHIEKPPFRDGTYDYHAYKEKLENTLIPLEVVFRFGVPEGSSILGRMGDKDYRRILGLHHCPKAGEKFNRPLIEFSTKLESSDRYISYSDAQKMAGLTDMEFSRLHSLCTLLALRLKDFFTQMNIELWDGKFEFAFSESTDSLLGRNIMLIDSIGPDELRLVSRGNKLSKEFLRTYYRDTPWLDAVEKAKTLARERGVKDWKAIVSNELNITPEHLSGDYLRAAAALYPCLANEVALHLGKDMPFPEIKGLDEFHKLLDKVLD